MNRRRTLRSTLLIAVAAGCMALGSAGAQSSVAVALNADARTLDPLSIRDTTTSLVLRNIYDSLFDWGVDDARGQLVPHLATGYTWDGDLEWIVTLREDVLFHNGQPLTADDVVATYAYTMDPANQALTRSRIEPIVSVEKLDEYTVRFLTNAPHATMLQSLQAIMIAPASIIAESGMTTLAANPVGTGAYSFVSWDREQRIVLQGHADYFEGAPEIDEIVFTVMPDINSRIAALLAGEVDLIYNLPPQAMTVVGQNPATDVRAAAPGRRIMFIGLDTVNEGPMQDVRVRQALNHAVNVDLIIEAVMEGYATRVPGPLVPQNQHVDPELQPYAYDPERARELLAEAGYADGLSLTFHSPQGRYLKDVEFAQAIAAQLAEVGINAQLQVHEWGNFLERLEGMQLSDMYLNGRPDLDLDGSILNNFFRTGQPFVSFSDATIDDMLQASLELVDPDERLAAFVELQATIQEAAPWIFLWAQHDLYGVSARLDWEPRDDEQLLMRFARLR